MSDPDFLQDPNAVLKDNVEWRHGKVPDYTAANKKYAAERTVVHPEGSLEHKVSCLVKNWEKEVSFKQRSKDFRTLDPSVWTMSVNGGKRYTLDNVLEHGSYTVLIGNQAFFCSSRLDFHESHSLFRRAMPTGFSWEVLEVWSGPPNVAFKWRHWGQMTGRLQCPLSNGMTIIAQPTMQEHGMCGSALARLDSDCRMVDLEIYFDQQQPMASMVRHSDDLANATSDGAPSTTSSDPQIAQSPVHKSGRRPDTAPSTRVLPSSNSRSKSSESTNKQSAELSAGESSKGGFGKGLRGWFTPRTG